MPMQSQHETPVEMAGSHCQASPGMADFERLLPCAQNLFSASTAVEGRLNTPAPPLAAKKSRVDRDIEEALVLCGRQKSFLDRIQAALERMSDLAMQAQDESHPARTTCQEEFQALAASVNHCAQRGVEGRKLFGGHLQTVRLEGGRNQLIMAGINLETKTFSCLSKLVLASPIEAVTALLRVKQALGTTMVFQVIVTQNLERLSFLGGQLDAIREGLGIVPPLAEGSPVSSR